MYVQFGSYRHTSNEVALSNLTQQRVFSPRNQMAFVRKTLTMEGHMCVSGVSAITAAIQSLEAGYQTEWNTLGLYDDNGTKTAHVLDFSTSLNGIRILTLDFPTADGGEYATGRSYKIVAQADYAGIHETQIYSWEETLTVVGNGGPDWELIPQFMGPPVLQVNCEQTPQHVIQSGESVGLTGYMEPPAPYWPNNCHWNRSTVERGTCQKKGRITNLLYPTKWRHNMSLMPYSVALSGVFPPDMGL